MSDSIDRTLAIATLVMAKETGSLMCKELKGVIEVLNRMPPAQQWIPCSARLPEEKVDVLLAFKNNMAVGFWEDILGNGEPAWYVNSGDGWFTGTEAVDNDGIPLSWMPLPEPYREVSE